MRSLGASWTVPAIAKGSRNGFAGTWIGAQEAPGVTAPFIQVGTNEVKGAVSGATIYYAFWTDTVRHFRAVPLFPVTPRTEVTASLRLAHGRWTVFIRDADSGREARFTTSEEGDASFGLGEWFQEDPGGPSSPVPYPAIQRVKFEKLRLNRVIPEYAHLHSQWMTVNAKNFGPSPLINDSFEVKPLTLSAAGDRYLSIADQVNPHFAAFDAKLRWKSTPNVTQLDATGARLAAALIRNISEVERAEWPTAAVGYIRALTTRTNQLLVNLKKIPTTPRQLNLWRQKLNSIEQAIEVSGQQTRRALGAPQISPTGG